MSSSSSSSFVQTDEAIAQSIIAVLFFLLAIIEGNSRILRVLDSRRQVVIRRTAQYFATQNYNSSLHHNPQSGSNLAKANSSNLGSGNNFNSNNNQGGSPRRTNSMGSAAQRQAGNLELQPLLTDNRFLLGVVASCVGVLRSAYVLSVLFLGNSSNDMQNESGFGNGTNSGSGGGHTDNHDHHFHRRSATTTSTRMTGDTVISDIITLPLAVLSYSLVLSVLFAHRDLMTKIRKAYDTSNPPASEHPEFPRNPASPTSQLQTTRSGSGGGGSGSGNNNNNSQNNTRSLPNLANKNGNSNSRTNSPASNENNNRRGSDGVDSSGGAVLINDGTSSNPNGQQDVSSKPFFESDFYLKSIRPYRAFLSMILVAVLLTTALVIEAISDQVRVTEFASPVISLALGFWSLYSTVESYIRLRFFGAASRRVIVAISILTLYLLVRGVIILPPIQEKLCAADAETGSSDYWKCFFAYSSVDALGMLISLVVLP